MPKTTVFVSRETLVDRLGRGARRARARLLLRDINPSRHDEATPADLCQRRRQRLSARRPAVDLVQSQRLDRRRNHVDGFHVRRECRTVEDGRVPGTTRHARCTRAQGKQTGVQCSAAACTARDHGGRRQPGQQADQADRRTDPRPDRRVADDDQGRFCDLLDVKTAEGGKVEVRRLTQDKLLVSHACWLAAYNSGNGYWVTSSQPPYAPVLVTTSATDYDKGVISSTQKGRGIGDCFSLATWTWDGRTFVQTSATTTGMCRQIAPGGAWDLPTLVTRVRK